MSEEFAARTAGDVDGDPVKSIEFADSEGTVRTLHARDGLFHPKDAQEDAALAGAGFAHDKESLKALDAKREEAAEKEAAAAQAEREKQTAAEEKAVLAAQRAAEKAGADEAATAQPDAEESK